MVRWDGWEGAKAGLRIAYSNQKDIIVHSSISLVFAQNFNSFLRQNITIFAKEIGDFEIFKVNFDYLKTCPEKKLF